MNKDNVTDIKRRYAYPIESSSIYDDDTIIVRTRNGERQIPSTKWWINRRTPVGEDAELWERKPNFGRRLIEWQDVMAVERTGCRF
jgi:hypothetical protein